VQIAHPKTFMLLLLLLAVFLVETGESAPTTQGTTFTKGKRPKKEFKLKNTFHTGLPIPNILRGKCDSLPNLQY
jgi:hypothetical protein